MIDIILRLVILLCNVRFYAYPQSSIKFSTSGFASSQTPVNVSVASERKNCVQNSTESWADSHMYVIVERITF